MEDLTTTSHTDLMKDKHTALAVIDVCQVALDLSMMTFRDGQSVQERLEANQEKVKAIDVELARREPKE